MVAAALGVVAAGCSTPSTAVGTGSTGRLPATTRPPTTSTVVQVTGALDPDRINLVLGDLPAGWSVSRSTTTVASPGDLRSGGLLRCLGRPASAVAGSSSPVFVDGRVSARSALSFVTPSSELSLEVQDLHTPAGLACLGQAITASLTSSGPLTGSTIVSLDETPGALDAALGVRYTASSSKGPLTVDAYLFDVGGNQLVVTFQATGEAPPLTAERSVLAKVLGRI